MMRKLLFLSSLIFFATLICLNTTANEKQSYPSAKEAKAKLQKKLDSIIIPIPDLGKDKKWTIKEFLNYLQWKSQELDPEKEGINIVITLPDSPVKIEDNDFKEEEKKKKEKGEKDRITSDGDSDDSISLGDAIRYTCRAGGLECRIDDYAVVIAPPGVLTKYKTKMLPLECDAIDTIGADDSDAVKKYFSDSGVTFPSGSTVKYDAHL